jgi:hypothetical protein
VQNHLEIDAGKLCVFAHKYLSREDRTLLFQIIYEKSFCINKYLWLETLALYQAKESRFDSAHLSNFKMVPFRDIREAKDGFR